MQTKTINQDKQSAQNVNRNENSKAEGNQDMDRHKVKTLTTSFVSDKLEDTIKEEKQLYSGIKFTSDDNCETSITKTKPALPPKPTKDPPPYKAPPRPPVPILAFRPGTVSTDTHTSRMSGKEFSGYNQNLSDPLLSISANVQLNEVSTMSSRQMSREGFFDKVDPSKPNPEVHIRRIPMSESITNNENESVSVKNNGDFRDVSGKLFGREKTTYRRNCVVTNVPENCVVTNHTYINMGHNLKSSFECEKVTPKETIGKPSQGKKCVSSSIDNITATRKPSTKGVFEHLPCNFRTVKQQVVSNNEFPRREWLELRMNSSTPVETPYYYVKDLQCNNKDVKSGSLTLYNTDTRVTSHVTENDSCLNYVKATGHKDTRPTDGRVLRDDAQTPSDQYKSSSESGLGTLGSGAQSLKSPASGKSRTTSAGSNLDTSIDSDNSIGEVGCPDESTATQNYETGRGMSKIAADTETFEWSDVGEVRKEHVCHSLKPIHLRRARETIQILDFDTSGTGSETMRVNPSLPSKPPPSFQIANQETLPKVSLQTKHKLSSRTDPLKNVDQSESNHCLTTTRNVDKGVPAKKSGIRKTTGATQSTFKHCGVHTKQTGMFKPIEKMANNHQRIDEYKSSENSRLVTTYTTRQAAAQNTNRIHLNTVHGITSDPVDAEVTSTTTCLDLESLLEDTYEDSSEVSATTSNTENDIGTIRKQLESLERMYYEVLRLLGLKSNKRGAKPRDGVSNCLRTTRRYIDGSLLSLTRRSSIGPGTNNFKDRRSQDYRLRTKESNHSVPNKRFLRLESHVVTLARSVAHLSSEMRTQQVIVRQLEVLRNDVNWLREQFRSLEDSAGDISSHFRGACACRKQHSREWKTFGRDVLKLPNIDKVQKLTKFFGDEPPLIRQLLKKLGYEKYASNFEREKIGILELPYLTDERLEKIGIPLGPRLRVLQEVKMAFQQDPLNSCFA
ncbi:uncharacterized protein LOC143251602 [Tachypleus tridentatus]|uniref:uncharacterized protein LOC143251602 n=1 Tax=Tachypleus tridentatus TaxID=6853 RepID=UPI003FCF0C1C